MARGIQRLVALHRADSIPDVDEIVNASAPFERLEHRLAICIEPSRLLSITQADLLLAV